MADTQLSTGLFKNVSQLKGSDSAVSTVKKAIADASPYVKAAELVIDALPAGKLKTVLSMSYIDAWKWLATKIFGRHWTEGDYVLGQVLNENVYHQPHIGQSSVTDSMVDAAHTIFNQLFGVRIATHDDLNALQSGAEAYKNRDVASDMSEEAIKRAVFLKQNYYYDGLGWWDLRYFEEYPLVDRIPDYNIGKWYSGPVVGGAMAYDGMIPIDADSALQQMIGAGFNPNPATTPASGSSDTSILAKIKANPGAAALIAGGLAFAAYEILNELE